MGADVRLRYYVSVVSLKELYKVLEDTSCLLRYSGELTFSKRFGFLEQGKDLENMMHHTGKAMDYIGIVSLHLFG